MKGDHAGLGERLWARAVNKYVKWPRIHGVRSVLAPINSNDSLSFMIWTYAVDTADFGVIFYIQSNSVDDHAHSSWITSLSGWWSGIATVKWVKNSSSLRPKVSIRATFNKPFMSSIRRLTDFTGVGSDCDWNEFIPCCSVLRSDLLSRTKDISKTLKKNGFVVKNYVSIYKGEVLPDNHPCKVCNHRCSDWPSRCRHYIGLRKTNDAYVAESEADNRNKRRRVRGQRRRRESIQQPGIGEPPPKKRKLC